MPQLLLRLANPEDAPEAAQCIAAAYARYDGRVDDLPDIAEGIADDIAGKNVWVADMNTHIAGVLVLLPRPDCLILANIAVRPDNAGMGLGKALMQLAENQAISLRKSEMRLSTHVAMPENVALYQHLGWHETERSGNKVFMAKSVALPNP